MGDAPTGHRDHVVPVAADLGLAGRRQVASGRVEPRQAGQPLRQQAALQGLGDPVLALVDAQVVDRQRDAIGREAQQKDVVLREAPRRRDADLQHARDGAAGEQRDAEDRVDAAQRRVGHVGGVGVLDEQRLLVAHDPTRQPLARRDPQRLLSDRREHRGLQGERAVLLGQQDRRRLGLDDLADARQERVEHVVEPVVRQRDVEQHLQAVHDAGHLLGLLARGLLAVELLALLLAALTVADVLEEADEQVAVADPDGGDPAIGQELLAVAATQHHLRLIRPPVALGALERQPATFLVTLLVAWDQQAELAQRLARRLLGGPAEHVLGRGVPGNYEAVLGERHVGVRSALDDRPRARLALAQHLLLARRLGGLGPQPVEQRRDHHPGQPRRADREDPADDRARRLLDQQDDHVRDPDQPEVRQRDRRPVEVEGVEAGPGEDDQVEGARADEVVRRGEDQAADGEGDVQRPGRDRVGPPEDDQPDGDRQRRQPVERPVLDGRVVREDERQAADERAAGEQVGERPRHQGTSEQLGWLRHGYSATGSRPVERRASAS
jgi:hypothetical protein